MILMEGPNSKVVLAMEGPLTVVQAGSLRESLSRALADGERVEVDLSEASEVDVAALQVLCSACRTDGKSGGAVVLRTNASGPFIEAVRDAGFEGALGACIECDTDKGQG